jgi:hypothetical protein
LPSSDLQRLITPNAHGSRNQGAVREATTANARRKVFDGGLFLLIDPPKSLGWRFKYRIAGREKLLSFGVYPEVPTVLARERRDEARRHLAACCDPSVIRKATENANANDFAASESLQQVLEADGHQVRVVGDGDQAIVQASLIPWQRLPVRDKWNPKVPDTGITIEPHTRTGRPPLQVGEFRRDASVAGDVS